MGITAKRLKELGLIDVIVAEPLGGAHRGAEMAAASLKEALITQLDNLKDKPVDELVSARYDRYMSYGNFDES